MTVYTGRGWGVCREWSSVDGSSFSLHFSVMNLYFCNYLVCSRSTGRGQKRE